MVRNLKLRGLSGNNSIFVLSYHRVVHDLRWRGVSSFEESEVGTVWGDSDRKTVITNIVQKILFLDLSKVYIVSLSFLALSSFSIIYLFITVFKKVFVCSFYRIRNKSSRIHAMLQLYFVQWRGFRCQADLRVRLLIRVSRRTKQFYVEVFITKVMGFPVKSFAFGLHRNQMGPCSTKTSWWLRQSHGGMDKGKKGRRR